MERTGTTNGRRKALSISFLPPPLPLLFTVGHVLSSLCIWSCLAHAQARQDGQLSFAARRLPPLLTLRGGDARADAEMESVWKDIKESTKATFDRCPLDEVKLSCNMDTFYSLFLSNNASHPIAKYQRERIGDSELETSEWDSQVEDARLGGGGVTRTIHYRHPVHAPMAPPSALATKTQTLKRFGRHGLVLETVTKVNDVPKTDCFIVEDRVLVQPSEDGDGVALSARFSIRFIKKTMFRPIIEKTTTGEFMKWFKGFCEYVTDALALGEDSV